MKTRCVSVVISSGLATGIALGFATQASAGEGLPQAPEGQARIAETTSKLENAFSKQFLQGQIDRTKLTGLVDEAVQAMPEAARPKTQQHIDMILDAGEKLASRMTPEERARAAAPPEYVGRVLTGLIDAWGWPAGTAGWGGLGAFGFPGMYYGSGGCTPGYGAVSPWGYSYGSECAYSSGYGYGGLGGGGWYW
jgi:hypothetical protein